MIVITVTTLQSEPHSPPMGRLAVTGRGKAEPDPGEVCIGMIIIKAAMNMINMRIMKLTTP